MTATVVLVHGAWHGAWCWDLVVRRLDDAGVATVALDNPSASLLHSTLHDDADNVCLALEEIEGPVVLVGHSYGGAVITDAGTHPAVAQLVYLTAFALDGEESCTSNALTGGVEGSELEKAIRIEDGVVVLDAGAASAAFYHDCPDDVATAAVGLLRPQSLAALTGVPRAVAWREKPSTYVVCTEDRALPVALQRSAATRANAVREMPTSHSPFLSRPDLVADLLIELSATLPRR